MALLSSAIQYGTHAARPTAGIAGRLYGESDTGNLFRDNGATWDQIATTGGGGGGGGATDANGVTAPPTTGWSWQNQASATITNAADGLWLYSPFDSADSYKLRMRTAPSPPYDVIAEIECALPQTNFSSYGLFVNKSGTGLAGIGGLSNGGYQLFAATGDSTHMTANIVSNGWHSVIRWFKVDVPASGNLTFSYSVDGVNWIAYASGASAYAGAETVGFGIDPRNGTFDVGALLRSWSAA